MKQFLAFIFLCSSYYSHAQSVGIGTTTPNPSSALDVSSSNKGFLPPRMSSSQRNAISNPRKGLMVYDTTQSEHVYFDGGKWRPFYEKNVDSSVVDYFGIANASTPFIMPITGGINIFDNFGIIYDNGGPTGNYASNCDYSIYMYADDSTLSINLNVEELNLESPYDSLTIFQRKTATNIFERIITLSGTQTGNFVFTNDIRILFKSNSVNNLSGFKIKWSKVRFGSAAATNAPIYGWHIDNKKHAAMGGIQRANAWHTDSVGLASFSYGINLKTKGNFSTALGSSNIATGEYAHVFGERSIASGLHATAIGEVTNASGNYATAIGYNSTASGFGSTAIGGYNVASGSASVALGSGTDATGNFSTSLGEITNASGRGSIASGYQSAARADYSMALGHYNIAKAFASTVIGLYNDSLLTNTLNSFPEFIPLFIIGNGNNGFRKNALVVYKNGNMDLNGNLKLNNGNAAAGKVLMASDAIGNSDWVNLSTALSSTATGFAANRTTTLPATPSTFTDVIFTTQSSDDGGDNYDPATGEFTAPTAGMYRFEASVFWASGIAGTENIYFYVNGVTRRFHTIVSANTGAHTLPFTASFKLNAGDVVKVVAYHTNATAVNISANGNGTYFTGVKVY